MTRHQLPISLLNYSSLIFSRCKNKQHIPFTCNKLVTIFVTAKRDKTLTDDSKYFINNKKCVPLQYKRTHSSMDRISDSGSDDWGSTPHGCTRMGDVSK